MLFKVGFRWELLDGEEVLLVVSGRREPEIAAKLTGHPDTWAPADGGQLEDLEISTIGGERLARKQEDALRADARFMRALDEAVSEAYETKRCRK